MPPGLLDDRGAQSDSAAMSNPVSAIVLGILGLAALVVASPTLTRLTSALVPLVLVVGIVAAVLRLAWSYTRKW
jgi:hypothetical protein